jgi:ribosomal protein S12 methylthiotransferase accessory factor
VTQLESLLDIVSPRTGILQTLNLRVKSADQPDRPLIYDGHLSHFDFRKGEPAERGSCGKGLSEETAMLGAIGEAEERYCAAHIPPSAVKRAAIAGLEGDAEAPTEFVLYSDAQYASQTLGFWRWKPADEISWTRVTQLDGSRDAWAPASIVYLSRPSDQIQDMLCEPNSSGFAAGPDVRRALRSALLELLERDAFTITWLARLKPAEIELAGVGGIAGEICATYERWGTSIRAFSLPTEMPATVVLALALDRTGDGPAAMIGLGCEMNPREALRKALFEICQMHEPLRRRHAEGAAEKLNAYTDVKTLDQHAAYFFRRDHLGELDFLTSGATKVRLGDIEDHSRGDVDAELGAIDSAIRAAGYRAYFRDVTTPDLEGYPIRVVRALVTGLQPIAFGYGMERLGGRRLFERGGLTETQVNRCPHPLA